MRSASHFMFLPVVSLAAFSTVLGLATAGTLLESIRLGVTKAALLVFTF